MISKIIHFLDSCFISFLWSLVDFLTSGDTSSSDKDDISTTQNATLITSSDKDGHLTEEKDSLNVAFADAFCRWLIPQLSKR